MLDNIKYLFSLKLIRFLRFQLLHRIFQLEKCLKLLFDFLHNGITYTLLIVIITSALCYFLPKELFAFTDSIRNQFFISLAVFVATLLTIVFSLKALVLQNSRDKFPAKFYSILTKDTIYDVFVFLIFVVTAIYFFYLSIMKDSTFNELGNDVYIKSTVMLLIINLSLLVNFFIRLYKRLDPFNSLLFIAKKAFNDIDEIFKEAEEIADLDIENPNSDTSIKERGLLIAKVLSRSIPRMGSILDYLFDYHDKQYSEKQKNFSRIILGQIFEILMYYLLKRQNTNVILCTAPFMYVSDSQTLFMNHLEEIIFRIDLYIKEKDEKSIRYILEKYESLLNQALSTSYVSDVDSSINPIFEQCFGYYKGLIGKIIKSDVDQHTEDPIFQATDSLARMSKTILDKSILQTVDIGNLLFEIYRKSLDRNYLISRNNSYTALIGLYAILISSKQECNHQIKEVYKCIVSAAQLSASKNKDRTDDGILTLMSTMATSLISSPAFGDDKTKREKLLMLIEHFIELLDSFEMTLYVDNEYFLTSIAETSANISSSLIVITSQSSDQRECMSLNSLVEKIINKIEFFFKGAMKSKGTRVAFKLIESITTIGLIATKFKNNNGQEKVLKVLEEMSKAYGLKDLEGYRFLLFKAYIVIYQLYYQLNPNLEALRDEIKQFEENYKNTFLNKTNIEKYNYGYSQTNPISYDLQQLSSRNRDFQNLRKQNMPIFDQADYLTRFIDPNALHQYVEEILGYKFEIRSFMPFR